MTVAVFEVAQRKGGAEAGGIVSTLGVKAIRAWSAPAIRGAIAEVQPYLDEASRLLAKDAAVATRGYWTLLDQWVKARRRVLAKVHAGSPPSEQYASYAEAARVSAEFRARVVVLERAGEVVARLADAHRKLLDETVDIGAAIVELKQLALQIKALRGALAAQ